MKKIVLLSMVLLLLLPAVSQAVEEKDYIGTWMQETYNEETGRYSVELLRLMEDHHAYYTVQVFYPGEVSIGRQAAKTWWVKGNGIHIVLGENTETDAIILDDGRLGFKLAGNTYSPLVKVSAPAQETNEESGVFVPGGYWEVGVDIPAGVYSIRSPQSVYSQNFTVYDRYNEETGLYTRLVINTILNRNNPLIGKVTLREGNVVHVDEGVYFDKPLTLGF